MVEVMMRYEDLLISSKYFYTEGSEDSRELFPDETKDDVSVKSEKKASNDSHTRRLNFGTMGNRIVLDVDVGLETACGDAEFLVI
jgi:hypothetical protein